MHKKKRFYKIDNYRNRRSISGELVCLLRTDKAHAVNRIPTKEDYELDELLNDL